MKVEVYKDASGDHRWRLRNAKNGRVMADSGEGYKRRAAAVAAWEKVAAGLRGGTMYSADAETGAFSFAYCVAEIPIQNAEE